MSERNKLDVKIGGKEYTIIAGESEEYMHKVAGFVDKKMSAIVKADNRLSTSMVAVLTAINVADEYMKLKESEDKLIAQLMEYTTEIERLKNANKELEQKKSAPAKVKNPALRREQVNSHS